MQQLLSYVHVHCVLTQLRYHFEFYFRYTAMKKNEKKPQTKSTLDSMQTLLVATIFLLFIVNI